MKDEAEKEMNALSHILKQFHKDQISLSNLKIKLGSLTEKIKKMREEKADLEHKFDNLLQKIGSVKDNYETVTREVLRGLERPNLALQSKIDKLRGVSQEKENELEYVVVG